VPPPTPASRQKRIFTPDAAMYKYTLWADRPRELQPGVLTRAFNLTIGRYRYIGYRASKMVRGRPL
jgi:hypothetical protein